MKLQTIILKASVEKSGTSYRAVISSASMDRDFEALLPEGCDPTDWDKSGRPVFWNHNYDMPIGKASPVKRRGDELVCDFQFAQRPDDFQGDDYFPEYVESLAAQGVVKGISVGFLPLENRAPSPKDFQRYGPDIRRIYSKWKLAEFSLAPMQSNTDAVIEGVAKGLLSRSLTLKHYANVPEVVLALNAPPPPPFRKTIAIDLGGGIDIDTEVNAAIAKARGCIYID